MNSSVRVVKLGGSLFDLADLRQRLDRWLPACEPGHTVWIAGGGLWVDALRRWQAVHGLTDAHAHEMAIRLMDVTVRLIGGWYPHWPVIHSLTELQSWDQVVRRARFQARNEPQAAGPSHVCFQCSDWLARQPDFPQSWDATSDSVAAALAVTLGADELILLKSVTPSSDIDREGLSQSGIVDRAFGRWASRLNRLRVVNLRAQPPQEWIDG